MTARDIARLCLIVSVAGCAAKRPPDPIPAPEIDRSAVVDSTPTRGGIADTEETTSPYLIDRTGARMATLRLRIAAYLAEHGSIPATIDDFFPPASRGFWEADFDRDAWKRPFRYTPKGSDYELRSAGPDGVFDTRDDIVVSRMIGTRWG